MKRIIVDAPLAEQLQAATNLVELCDRSGRVLGSFSPTLDPTQYELRDPSGRVLGRFSPAIDPSQYEPREPEISEEELERRRHSTTWYTTEEVLKYLENL